MSSRGTRTRVSLPGAGQKRGWRRRGAVQPHRGVTGHRRCSLRGPRALGCLSVGPPRSSAAPCPVDAPPPPLLALFPPRSLGFSFVGSVFFSVCLFLILCNIPPPGALKKALSKNRPPVSYWVSRFTTDSTWFLLARGVSRPWSPRPPRTPGGGETARVCVSF